MSSPFELILQSLKDYQKEASTLIGYAAWLILPFFVSVAVSFLPITPVVQAFAILLAVAELLFVIWITTILCLCAHAVVFEQKTNIPTISQQAKQLILPVLTINLLQLLIFLGGFLLLVLPVFLFAVWFGLAQFMVMFENKRSFDALSASRDLTKGRFWQSARLLLIGPLILLFTFSFLISLIISIVSAIYSIDPTQLLSGDTPLWIDGLETVGELFLFPLVLLYFTRVYRELREHPLQLEKSPEIA